MESLEEIVKRERAIGRDNEFSVERETRRLERAQAINDLRKVARQRLSGFRLQLDLVTIAERQATKTVPLRFILPARPVRHFID